MSNEVLSQDQIEEMLRDAGHIEEATESAPALSIDDYLTTDEQDILGEMGNICMGAAATTMFALLTHQTNITTPRLCVLTIEQLSNEYPYPLVVVEVQYTEGVAGNNLLILKREDVALITDLLLGGDGKIDLSTVQMDELHLSAIQEVMNQMVGSSATSLSEMLNKVVNISTPVAREMTIKDEPISAAFSSPDDKVVKISFTMEIEGVLTSEIMQVLPIAFAKELASEILKKMTGSEAPLEKIEDKKPEPPQQSMPAPAAAAPVYSAAPPAYTSAPEQAAYAPPQAAYAPPQAPYAPTQQVYEPARPNNLVVNHGGVDVKTAQFPNFDDAAYGGNAQGIPANIGMIMDVPMKVTVQLGKTHKKIKEILDFNTGSVIVLDKLAGEEVDILVNGKIIGRGEVVVIDDNYGVRITEINVPPAETLV